MPKGQGLTGIGSADLRLDLIGAVGSDLDGSGSMGRVDGDAVTPAATFAAAGGGELAGLHPNGGPELGSAWVMAWELAGETTNPSAGFARGIGGHSELTTASGGALIPARPRG